MSEMTVNPENNTGLRLSNLDLRIGQTLQLIAHGPQPAKHYTRLIGFVEQEFLMLRVPVENGWTVTFDEGQRFDVRVFSGVSLFEFETRLQTLLLHPRNYMLMACPTTIRQTQLRSHERVPCALSVRVTRTPAGQSEPSAYRLQDLSGSGAALVGPRALGEPGQSLQLGLDFDLAATGTHEELLLGGDIQTVQPLKDASGQVKAYLHGIAFHKVEPRVLLLVYELQKPLAQGVRRA